MQILPAWIVFRLRRAGWGFAGMQKLARRASPRDGIASTEEYPASETRRVGLCAEHNLLWQRWIIVHSLWHLSTQMAGIAGGRLFDDRAGVALGGSGKLFGEQKV